MLNVDKKLIDKVLGLKPQEKIFIIEALVESLDKSDKYVKIWLKEAKERLEAHRRGDTKGVPVEEILRESL